MAARWGNEAAFAEIFETLYPKVYSFLWRRTARPEDVEEIAAETFVSVFKGLKIFEPAYEGAFSAWVFRIARHRLIDRIRKDSGSREQLVDPVDLHEAEADQADEVIDPAELPSGSDLADAVAALPEAQRSCILLRFVADMSIDQVADVMERTPNAIKQLQFRALSNLRQDPSLRQLRGES